MWGGDWGATRLVCGKGCEERRTRFATWFELMQTWGISFLKEKK